MLTMDLVILSAIVLFIKCSANTFDIADNPHIFLKRFSSSKHENMARRYTVVRNKPLYVHFQDMTISRGWCFNYYVHEARLDKWLPPKVTNNTISIANVSHDMSTLWKCNVTEIHGAYKNGTYQNDSAYKNDGAYKDDGAYKNDSNNIKDLRNLDGDYHVFYLKLHVKGAKSVKMTVDDTELAFSETKLSDPYDGETIYFYKGDELVRIDCKNPTRTGTVRLEYFTKGTTNISDNGSFFIQLHLGSNNSYVDCIYETTQPTDTYIYRAYFVSKNTLININKTETVTVPSIQDKTSKSPSVILGSSIGVVIVILSLTGVVCWYVRTRNAKHSETPYQDFINHSDSVVPQYTQDNQYDTCHEITEREEDIIDPMDHFYTEIDYFSCKPKIEVQTRNSCVYDEPYVQMTI